MKVEVITQVFLTPGNNGEPIIDKTVLRLFLPSFVNELAYFENGYPNEKGVQCLTSTLIEGLVGNVHGAHSRGIKDKSEHLQYIIEELAKKCGAKVNVYPNGDTV